MFLLLAMPVEALNDSAMRTANQMVSNQVKILCDLDDESSLRMVTIKDTREVNNSDGAAGPEEYALQVKKEMENGDVEVSLLIPYKIDSEGGMYNSFAYASTRASSTHNTSFVDVVITVVTYYAAYQCSDYAWVYRHAGFDASWNASSSTTTVSNMLVQYDTCGDLYEYPSVVNVGVMNSQTLQSDYFIRSAVNINSPTKNQTYSDNDTSHIMPYSRVIYCSNYFNHGGLIYVQCSYSANGTSYTHDNSYYVYQK